MILETLDGPHTEPSGLRGPEATKRADLRHPQEEFEGPFGGIEKAESGVEVVPGDSPGLEDSSLQAAGDSWRCSLQSSS